MNQELLDRKSAKVIREWVEEHGGIMVETCEFDKRNIRIEKIDCIITTSEIHDWIHWGANVYFGQGLLNISNWPEPGKAEEVEEKVFEVKIRGEVEAERINKALCNELGDERIISVKEKSEKEE